DLREGGDFAAPGRAHGRILQVQAPHRLGLTWQSAASEDALLVRLDPEDDGTTELVLRHTLHADAEEFARTGPGTWALDWELTLLALAAHTDGWRAACQASLPRPTPEWLEGPHGQAHLRAWSVRWAAEAVAAGVEEATARRGESETLRHRPGR